MQTNEWDTRLDEILLAYRASKHTSTGFSPALLTYGRELLLPAQLAAEAAAKAAAAQSAGENQDNAIDLCNSDGEGDSDQQVMQHLHQTLDTLNQATPKAVGNIAAAQDKQASNYKARHGLGPPPATCMPIGSFVSVRIEPTNKLEASTEGPYRVKGYDDRQTTVLLEDATGKTWSRHVSLVAPYQM
jgi:hypothetical protein